MCTIFWNLCDFLTLWFHEPCGVIRERPMPQAFGCPNANSVDAHQSSFVCYKLRFCICQLNSFCRIVPSPSSSKFHARSTSFTNVWCSAAGFLTESWAFSINITWFCNSVTCFLSSSTVFTSDSVVVSLLPGLFSQQASFVHSAFVRRFSPYFQLESDDKSRIKY